MPLLQKLRVSGDYLLNLLGDEVPIRGRIVRAWREGSQVVLVIDREPKRQVNGVVFQPLEKKA